MARQMSSFEAVKSQVEELLGGLTRIVEGEPYAALDHEQRWELHLLVENVGDPFRDGWADTFTTDQEAKAEAKVQRRIYEAVAAAGEAS